MRNRPSWNDYLLGLAKAATARSHDENTQHGAVATNDNHQILSMGCNGLVRGLKDDSRMPTGREKKKYVGYGPNGYDEFETNKYPFMIHAEENLLANSNGSLRGATVYITGSSCLHCMQLLWQHGVKKIIQVNGYGWSRDDEEAPLKRLFLQQSGMQVENVTPDLTWLVDLVLNDPDLKKIVEQKLSK